MRWFFAVVLFSLIIPLFAVAKIEKAVRKPSSNQLINCRDFSHREIRDVQWVEGSILASCPTFVTTAAGNVYNNEQSVLHLVKTKQKKDGSKLCEYNREKASATTREIGLWCDSTF